MEEQLGQGCELFLDHDERIPPKAAVTMQSGITMGQVDKNAKRAVHSFLFGTTGDDDDAGEPPKSALMEFCVEDMDTYGDRVFGKINALIRNCLAHPAVVRTGNREEGVAVVLLAELHQWDR